MQSDIRTTESWPKFHPNQRLSHEIIFTANRSTIQSADLLLGIELPPVRFPGHGFSDQRGIVQR